jgi:hypothetical protein
MKMLRQPSTWGFLVAISVIGYGVNGWEGMGYALGGCCIGLVLGRWTPVQPFRASLVILVGICAIAAALALGWGWRGVVPVLILVACGLVGLALLDRPSSRGDLQSIGPTQSGVTAGYVPDAPPDNHPV